MSVSTRYHIALVGCGKMGASMMHGWLKNDLIGHGYCLDPNGLPDPFQQEKRVSLLPHPGDLKSLALDLIILAVKPQIMPTVCGDIASYIGETTPILSIAAGQSIATIAKYLHPDQPIIRAMPNTPAAIGKGMTAAITGQNVSRETKSSITALIECSGDLVWLDNETQMDAVTALSGSGPAYVFHLIEVMAEAGINLGLPSDQAQQLARQTVIGAAYLADDQKDLSARVLRENVTSPGGTTAAALDVLMDGRLQDIYNEALLAAKNRCLALSS